MRFNPSILISALGLVLSLGCGSAGNPSADGRNRGGGPPLLTVGQLAPMLDSKKQALTAALSNGEGFHLQWSTTAGTIQTELEGEVPVLKYTSPETPGSYTVTAKVAEWPSVTASTTVEVRKINVTVDPKISTILLGSPLYVHAAVTGGYPETAGVAAITWVTSGGTVDANNIYHSPDKSGLYIVRAVSTKDARKFDEAVVQVGGDVAVYLTPREVVMKVGETQQFTVIVFGTDRKDIYWTATGGTIEESGLYTAKEAGTWKITAMSVVDPSKTAEAVITVNP